MNLVLLSLPDSLHATRTGKMAKMKGVATSLPWPRSPEKLDLGESEVHVWSASLDVVPEKQSQFEQILSEDERTRAARFHFQSDRNHYIVGRGLLRHSALSFTGRSRRDRGDRSPGLSAVGQLQGDLRAGFHRGDVDLGRGELRGDRFVELWPIEARSCAG